MMPKHSLSARLLTALLAVSTFTLAACDSGDGGTPGGTTVSVVTIVTVPNAQTLTNLAPGTTRQMLGVPTNEAGNWVDKDVTYASSNNAVFTVTAGGLVTAVAGGNAYLRASAGGRIDSVLVAVRYPVATVTIAPAAPLNMRREETRQLTVTTIDTQGATVTGRTIIWTSDTPANVSVSATGLAAAQAAPADGQTATITATANNAVDGVANVAGTRLITINGDATVATVTIAGANTPAFYGHTAADVQLTATALSGLGNTIGSAVFAWTSTSAASATVGAANGLVDIVAAGTPTIRATTETFTGSGVTRQGSQALEVATTLSSGANVIATIPNNTVRSYALAATAGVGVTLATSAGTSGDVDMAGWNPSQVTWTFTSNAGSSSAGRVCNSGASGNVESCAFTPAVTGFYRIALLAWGGAAFGFTQDVAGVTLTLTP